MPDEKSEQEQAAQDVASIDPTQLELLRDRLRSQQNLPAGILAGAVGSLAGAAVWAAVTVFTGYQIGWMAVGIGFLVGYLVRVAGKGVDMMFGVAGATLALLGCALGNLMAICGLIAREQGVPFFDVMSNLDAGIVQELMITTFSPMDLVFYGIALYEGYKLAFRQMTEADLAELVG